MTEFRFAYPLALPILLWPLAVYFIPVFRRFCPEAGRLLYSDTRLMKGLSIGRRIRLRYLPDMLRWLAWILLLIGLARPQTGRAYEVVRGQGIDIVLALDISGSMATVDFQPYNRLDAAQSVLADFIERREFDHIGLVVFARNAFHQAPPTLDYPILLQLLDQIVIVTDLQEAESRRLDGTAIGLGLASSANMLRHSTADSRIIILLTDGDNNAGIDPLQAARAVAALGIRIYTIGVGQPGQQTLDEELLQEIAAIGDGGYFRATDTIELQQIYNRIDQLERSDVERRLFIRWKDQAWLLLTIAFCLLIVERLLRRAVFQTVP